MDRNEEEMVPNDSDPLLKRENDEAESSLELTPPKPATVSTLEIEDEETDGSSAGCCRICLETDSELGDELISPCMCKGTQQFVHRSCLDHWRSVKEGFAFSHCTTCKAQFHLRVETWEDNSWRKMKFRIFVARDVILVFLAVQLVSITILKHYFEMCFYALQRKNCTDFKGDERPRLDVAALPPLSLVLLRLRCRPASPHRPRRLAHQLCLFATIAMVGAISYFLDRDGSFRNSFSDGWDRFLSKHPIPFYYCIGVVVFFVLLGFFGLILHCSSFNDNQDPCLAGCRNCCYGWGVLDCLPASLEACFALVVVFVVVFAILGIAYGFLAATMAEYVVEDLHGNYTPPKLDPEHEERLKMLKLL
uniref:RING-CH-type domain-containing protein n=1 Tax=Oryza punctata TaxID=4537 RepID=A0A0E0LUI2_ORYPU